MAELHIGAARYQLLEGLWRGRGRVIYDPELLAQVLETDREDASASRGVALLQELFMGEGAVWIVVDGADEVVTYARALPDARFVTLRQAAAIGLDPQWTVAMFAVDAAAGVGEGVASAVSRDLKAAIEQFVTERGRGRSVVAFSDVDGVGDVDEASFEAWTGAVMGEPRTFVFGRPDMVTVHAVGESTAPPLVVDEEEFGEGDGDDEDEETTYFVRRTRSDVASSGAMEARWRDALGAPGRSPGASMATLGAHGYDEDLDEAEQSWTGRGQRSDPAGTSEDVTVSYDNELGDDAPTAVGWMAVLGGPRDIDEVTLLDLGVMMPSFEEPGEDPGEVGHTPRTGTFDARGGRSVAAEGGQEREALLARLAHARARADEAVIERQRLLEELDLARAESSAGESAPLEQGDAALAEAHAELQGLRWSLEQARAQVDTLRARAVDAHEREVAVLYAKIERLETGTRSADSPGGTEVEPVTQPPSGSRDVVTQAFGVSDGATAAVPASPAVSANPGQSSRREWAVAMEEIQVLMRRLERGGGSALEIHRALRGVLGRLRRLG